MKEGKNEMEKKKKAKKGYFSNEEMREFEKNERSKAVGDASIMF